MTANKKEVLNILESKAGNISATCKSANISRQTFYDWVSKDANFKRGVEDVKESLIDFAESKLMELISEKNPTALIFFLKTQAKQRGYVERQELDVGVTESLSEAKSIANELKDE